MKDYYKILEISNIASDEVIYMAYKALVKKYHPDVNGQNQIEANEKIKEINEAYSVLSDPFKRQKYDEQYYIMKNAGMKESVVDEQENRSNESAKTSLENSNERKDKRKWYYSCPILILTLYFCFPVSLILTILRFKDIKQQSGSYRTRTKVMVGIQAVPFAIIILALVLASFDQTENTGTKEVVSETEVQERESNPEILNAQKKVEGSQNNIKSEKTQRQIEDTKSETEERVEETASETTSNSMQAADLEKEDYELSGYICRTANTEQLDISDVESFTNDEMLLAIDEIFARHGVIFENKYRNNYFQQRTWYQPRTAQIDFNDKELSEIEKKNIEFLRDVNNGVTEIPSDLPSEMVTINICTEYQVSLGKKGIIEIYVDNKKIGEIGVNQNNVYDVLVDEGKHELKVKYGVNQDMVSFDTNLKSEYWYICKYKTLGIEIGEGWDSHYMEVDESYMVSVGRNKKEGEILINEKDYINYIRNGKTPTFDKNCKIGYLLESIMTNSAWECKINSTNAQVIYTGVYNSNDVEIIFEFTKEGVKPIKCKIGVEIYENSLDILFVFQEFEDDYLRELKNYSSLDEYYKHIVREPAKTLLDQDYILPESNQRFYTYDELKELSNEELQYAVYEIYARRGLIFEDLDVKNHFLGKTWYFEKWGGSGYSIKYFDTTCFNEYERSNLDLLGSMNSEIILDMQ